ncbi:MAG: glycogen debranching protein GlgX [Myxococcales bacterium]|nr:glycogen debranching protein GlgX [Myxococcales bacterium]
MIQAKLEVWPGVPYPLGATFDGRGINFAVYSERAEGIDVCLFDPSDCSQEVARFPLMDVTHHVWHRYVPGLPAGTLYGFRAKGPYEPKRGLRFNHHKLLVDPYARAIHGKVNWKAPVHGYKVDSKDKERDLTFDDRDDAAGVPKSVVVADDFDWGDDKPPGHIWRFAVVYELHVKGFTARHPGIPEKLRGTYAGLAHPAAIEHLTKLGVTSVELLPVHEAVDDGFLGERGLTNYWGYNTLGYFAPDQRFCSSGSHGEQVREFKQMVKALHQAGIEVILDVVYNHTAEGNELGPTLCFRGLDNPTYYWLMADEPNRYLNVTGCGNSVNASHPQVAKLIADSLRCWVTEMRVDGFRFDLATTLGRTGKGEFDRRAAFLQILHQDPVLSRVKLIAEPWDLGPDGHKVGNFPVLFAEWNDRFREAIRRFWKGDERQAAEIGYRVTGSSDLLKLSGRRPTASVNYVTSHDGFTLHDLVTYERKHNEANGEANRDGANDNYAWNCGVEGETDDPAIQALRQKQLRNLIATLFLSQGTPMLCAGDEMGRTQKGNNNAYCQDNELSWVDWRLDERKSRLFEFTARMIRLRKEQPVLQRRNFFLGATIGDSRFKDLVWFRPDGAEMSPEDWAAPYRRSLGYLLGGDAIASRDPEGRRIVGDTLLVLLNAHHEPVEFTVPGVEWGAEWQLALDTAKEVEASGAVKAGAKLELKGRSLMALRHPA